MKYLNIKYYLSDDGIYKRKQGTEVRDKHKEFLCLLEDITGQPHDPNNLMEAYCLRKVHEECDQCMCSKHIKHICVLEHLPTKKYIQCGCVCVLNQYPKFAKILRAELSEVKKPKCKTCNEKLKANQEHVCNRQCRICKEYNIDPNREWWFKACTPCYKKERYNKLV
jgi:hypothetical protein